MIDTLRGFNSRRLHSRKESGWPATADGGLADKLMAAKTGDVNSPDVRYAQSGDAAIAYFVVGHGPRDLVFAPFMYAPRASAACVADRMRQCPVDRLIPKRLRDPVPGSATVSPYDGEGDAS